MNKSCQASCVIQRLPFMGNPKYVVVHDLNRTLANYNQASYEMIKKDIEQYCKLLNVITLCPK